ncbi:MAG: sialate O-acetylesterase [Ruminococcaceae bacterium]|nr:sialate O-acetylesterase [Oscillospiraceae bacterium]
MKRIVALILTLVMLLSFAACKSDEDAPPADGGNNPAQDAVDPSKIIDIYLIAGQSNAVGHTGFYNNDMTSYYEHYLSQFAPELARGGNGYTHIHYAGNSRKDKTENDVRTLVNQDKPWQKISMGLGSYENNIGPEVGMARALAKYYNAESGRSAGIIKFAHGGTSIRDLDTGSNQFGNWVSPSYAKDLGVSYEDNDVTGALYRGLLDQVKRNISELYEYGGYEQINIRGLYWMQGESDRHAYDIYEKAFTYFVNDLRKDLSEIMLEFTGGKSDLGAGNMGIFVGAISLGYNVRGAEDLYNNTEFINMQKSLGDKIENCYFVNNSGYAITKWDPQTGTVETLGWDNHHWNAVDMLNIGNNVGKMMFDKCVRNGSTK